MLPFLPALRIHVSDNCKTLLDQLGKYEFTERGQIEVKVRRIKFLMERVSHINMMWISYTSTPCSQ